MRFHRTNEFVWEILEAYERREKKARCVNVRSSGTSSRAAPRVIVIWHRWCNWCTGSTWCDIFYWTPRLNTPKSAYMCCVKRFVLSMYARYSLAFVAREPRRKYRIIRSGKIIVMRFLFLLLLLRAQRWQMKLQSFEYRAKWSISLRWSEQFRDDHQPLYFAYRYNSTKITLHRVTLFNCRTQTITTRIFLSHY